MRLISTEQDKIDRKVANSSLILDESVGDKVVNLNTGERISTLELANYQRRQSKKVCAWLRDHPAFKWSRMCRELGMNTGNFSRTLKGKNPLIALDKLALIEEKIKQYGYKP